MCSYKGGYVVTNAHVTWPYAAVRIVFPDGTEFHEVPVKGWDPLVDLAVLGPIRRTGGLRFSQVGEALPQGTGVFLIGYPGELETNPQPTVVRGADFEIQRGLGDHVHSV